MTVWSEAQGRPAGLSARRARKALTPYLYLVPAFFVMTIITFYPMAYQVYMSFTDYGLANLRVNSPAPEWLGLGNYISVLCGRAAWCRELPASLAPLAPNGVPTLVIPNFDFWRTLLFNLFWTFSNVPIHVAVGILLAVILNTEGLWGKGLYRAIYILPIVIPQIIIASVWRNMYDPDYGAINQALAIAGGVFGLSPELFHIRWIDQIQPIVNAGGFTLTLSYFALLITNIWLGWPFMTIVATGALQSIPKDLYEAAAIDGASGNQQFWSITLPLLRPAMVPASVYGIVATFNLFGLIYFLSGGGPVRQTEILLTTAFRLINEQRLYGIAAAFCVYIFFILLALTLMVNRVTRATESYDV